MEIVDRAVSALVGHAVALRERLGEGAGTTVALVGGVVEPGGPLHARMEASLRFVGLQPTDRVVDGPAGAARIALRRLSAEAPPT
jgi:hypothetical protein